jgi:hypothetical protein
MTDHGIRDHIEMLAPPLSLDEVIDTSVVTRVVSTNSVHRVRPRAIAAALIAVLGLAGLALIASRDTDSVAPGAAEAIALEVNPDDPVMGTSFVATLTGDDLDQFTVRREAYIEQLNGDSWNRIWLVYPVFVDATGVPPAPIDLVRDGEPSGLSPIQFVATRPFRIVLPQQLAAGSYRLCLQAGRSGSSVGSDYCAAIVVRDPASTVTSVPTIGSVPPTGDPTAIGVEEPLVEIPITAGQEVTKPGSAHAFSVDGHPPILVWTTVMPNLLTGRVEEWQCVSEQGSSGCGPTALPAQFSQTSSIDNHFASDDLFTWSNLPPDVDTVRYDDGVKKLWQRPIAGLAIFRVDPDHSHPDVTAYDASGALLPYSFWGENAPLNPATETTHETAAAVPPTPSAIGDMFGDLRSLAQSSMHDCLTANGATWTETDVPTFAAGVDSEAIWNSCVERVRSIVAARQVELTPTTTGP